MKDRGPGQKGSFGPHRLPVARRYLLPDFRNRLLLAAAAVAGIVIFVALIDAFAGSGALVSNGPLASGHAKLEADCGSCHGGFAGVTNERCADCHERFGDRSGAFSLAAHEIYRSSDPGRLEDGVEEVPCAGCHDEHLGRDASIVRVSDRKCLACHPVGSFERGHPEFDFAAEAAEDPAGQRFPHVHHVREVRKAEGVERLEEACLYCHPPQPDGRGFEPLDFERDCGACHLPASAATGRLPVGSPDDPARPGVESLQAIRGRGDLGDGWAAAANPQDFRTVEGGRIQKLPVEHADPWVLANLRRLRATAFPDAGLADLLRSSADLPNGDPKVLYEEAIAALEDHADELRTHPEPRARDERRRVQTELRRLRRAVESPFTPLEPAAFELPPEEGAAAERLGRIEPLVAGLTESCQRCHAIERATVVRVQKDQRVLRRAEFDHRAHVLEAGCFDCHRAIDFDGLAPGAEPVPAELDRAEIQNVPAIATCRACHGASLVSSRCVDCHLYHPDKSRRAELLVTLE